MEFKEKWEVILGDRHSYAKIKIRAGVFDLRSLDLKSEQFKEENCIAKLIASAPEMFEMLKEANQTIQRLRLLISAHPDCVDGSEFVDYVNFSYKKEKEIEKLLKKITE